MIQYPKGHGKISSPQTSTVIYGSRGMFLETLLNQTNDYYRLRKIAVIHKKPTPIQVVKVDYPKRSAAVIKEAYYRHASTTEYYLLESQYLISFIKENKENKKSIPLDYIKKYGEPIPLTVQSILDYIPVVDKLIDKI